MEHHVLALSVTDVVGVNHRLRAFPCGENEPSPRLLNSLAHIYPCQRRGTNIYCL